MAITGAIPREASLKKIEQVSNYKFFYNENLPELNQKVSLNVQNATIQQVMKQLLGKMELTYKQEQENIIVLIRKEQEKKRNINVSGTVVDEKGLVYGLSGDSTVQCYKVYAILRMQSDDINKIFCGQRI